MDAAARVARDAAIVWSFEAGASITELAAVCGMKPAAVSAVLARRRAEGGLTRPRSRQGRRAGTTSERRAQIAALAGDGRSVDEIAAELGVGRRRVAVVVRSLRADGTLERPPTPDLSARNAGIVDAYRAGATLDDIGQRVGLTRERVRQIVAAAGATEDTSSRAVRRYEVWAEAHRTEIFELFDTVGSVSGVAAQVDGPDAWVRRLLADRPRRRVPVLPRRRVWSDADILGALTAAAGDRAELSTYRYDRWRTDGGVGPTVITVITRFGSWAAAVAAAGLEPSRAGRPRGWRWDADDCRAAVAAFVADALTEGTPVSHTGYERWHADHPDRPSLATIRVLTAGIRWSTLANDAIDAHTATADVAGAARTAA